MSRQRFGTDKDIKKYIRRAQRQGWEVRCDGSQHIRITPPGGAPFTIPMTPGSQRRTRGAIRSFRKAGLE